MHLFIQLLIHAIADLLIQTVIQLFTQSLVQSSVHTLMRLTIQSFIDSFVLVVHEYHSAHPEDQRRCFWWIVL